MQNVDLIKDLRASKRERENLQNHCMQIDGCWRREATAKGKKEEHNERDLSFSLLHHNEFVIVHTIKRLSE